MNLKLIAEEYEIAAQLEREENPEEFTLPEDTDPAVEEDNKLPFDLD